MEKPGKLKVGLPWIYFYCIFIFRAISYFMLSVVYYDPCLSYHMILKTRHSKLCVFTPWFFQLTDRYWPECIHSDTKACFCLHSRSTLRD